MPDAVAGRGDARIVARIAIESSVPERRDVRDLRSSSSFQPGDAIGADVGLSRARHKVFGACLFARELRNECAGV
ncbi:hypothetical protein ASE35_17730 [Lysobacter sp. Root916]|nr:hypothetical protein ASE35_17730 [Lysobacter sp. Root916]